MSETVGKRGAEPPEDNEALDFKKNSILYALKAHNPPRNLYCSNVSPSLMKERVLESPRIKQIIREVSKYTFQLFNYAAKSVLKQRWQLRIWPVLWSRLV